MDTAVYFCEPTGRIRGWLRRYASSAPCSHPGNHGYHDAHVLVVQDAPELFEAQEDEPLKHFPKNDPRWPRKCACGFEFQEHHNWQYMTRKIYRRVDGAGPEFILREPGAGREAPLGAMWDTNWYQLEPGLDRRVGPDGMSLCVVVPGNQTWSPDARADNCTSPCKYCGVEYHAHKSETCTNPGDGERAWTKGQYVDSVPQHYCWVRSGDVRSGQIHVSKDGLSCRAGAGSILTRGNPARGIPSWHGFLHHGKLTGCP